jgi:hypothetical protein
MKKVSLVAAGMLIALAAIPAIADGTADQLRTRRTDLLRRDAPALSTPVVNSGLPGRDEHLSVGRVSPRLETTPVVPVVLDDFSPDFTEATLETTESIVVPDVKLLDFGLNVAVPAEQAARIRQELSTIYLLDLPVEEH